MRKVDEKRQTLSLTTDFPSTLKLAGDGVLKTVVLASVIQTLAACNGDVGYFTLRINELKASIKFELSEAFPFF